MRAVPVARAWTPPEMCRPPPRRPLGRKLPWWLPLPCAPLSACGGKSWTQLGAIRSFKESFTY